MITIHELLEDPKYREFFLQVPKLPAVAAMNPTSPPWRVWVLLKGSKQPWRKKDFHTYPEAFNFLKKRLKRGDVADAAINCRRMTFAPPMRMARIKGKFIKGSDGKMRQATKRVEWRVKLPADEHENHRWCPYCRRPTVFRYYSKHHALATVAQGIIIDQSIKRCCICGISERLATYGRPQ